MRAHRLILLSSLVLAFSACAVSGPMRFPSASMSWTAPSWTQASADPVAGLANGWSAGSPASAAAVGEGHGFLWGLAMYLPNRIFDVFDIVRARLRIGPGIGLGLRATEVADVYLGTYVSIWVGLHGHRGEPEIPWPFGFESVTGAELSVADATVDAGGNPQYGPFEFGLDTQLLLVGFAIGIEPFEIVDFITGLIGIDPSGDDF